ncbi:MAG: hypothetical protein HY646_04020 [Acidobacteria bacterium]|nr:hypothetical protein [Acidobacteriota bacterium]
MRVSTNIDGLDQILRGGLIGSRAYLVHGASGTGKTTVGFHFLAGSDRTLLVSFTEAEESLRADARAIGLDIDRVKCLDLSPAAESFAEKRTYDIFSPGEVERESVAQLIVTTVESVRPQRVFVDGFNVFRSLASDSFHYYRLVQSFFRFATKHGCTVLVASEEPDCASIVDGVIHLEFTRANRFVRVTKLRGSDFQPGRHPMRLTAAGIQVLPNAA